ncbi:type III pantothenate kinase [Humisphaera borealis]|uniref:Type III pantothenate kinase n=1 Tax=Humisphaera borealis TaxID=2807512 RepID=A0A7M2WYP6_9BACT|nr:type III pantothenate kinase [Humisphaera borealis]QOV90596.1 type III pantothenate kinase [Humisphaera borealis]
MEINLVVVNVGNSRVAIGSFVAGELTGDVERIAVVRREEWAQAVERAWQRISGRENAAIVAAGVNPDVQSALSDVVSERIDRRVVWVGKDLDLPIKVLTDEPEKTGIDRILNVAAAYEQTEMETVVVDAGTAITLSACNDAGEFLGGAIAPGVRMQLDALHERTAALPLITTEEFKAPDEPYGQNTKQAMLHGVYHGIRGMVKEIVEAYATQMGKWPEVVATGGDAQALFSGWEIVTGITPDLTLYGIAKAYADHHIKHDSE